MSYTQQITFLNDQNVVQNPLQDETVILLRRMARLMESWSTRYLNNQQIMVVGDFPPNTVGFGSIGRITGSINGIANSSTAGSNLGPAQAPTVMASPLQFLVQSTWEGPVDQRWKIINDTRGIYADCIRKSLI